MKTAEAKSTHSQQHAAAETCFFNKGQDSAFFSEQSSEYRPFFSSASTSSFIQPKSVPGHQPFFQPAAVPLIQAKCTECEAEEREQQKEQSAETLTAQRMPAFESEEAPVQAKLTVGQPGDQYEQEADRVATTLVNRMNTPGLGNLSQSQSGQTSFQENSEFQQGVFRQALEVSVPNVQGDFETRLNRAKGGGSPLDKAFRAKVEPEMRADFSRVKVHTDAEADRLNRSIQAKAFTTGQDIFFRQGTYEPESQQGQELLAHELTHVVQQTGLPQRRVQRRPIRQGPNQWLLTDVPISTSYTDFLQSVFRECCWITTCRSDRGDFLDDLLVNHSNLEDIHTWIKDKPRNRNNTTRDFIRDPEQFYNVPINEIRSVNLRLRTDLNEEESAIGAFEFKVTQRRLINERLPCTSERTLDVFAVYLPGATRNVQSDIRDANNILCQCGIELNLAGGQSWSTNLLDRTPPHNTLNFYGGIRGISADHDRETLDMLAHRPGGNMIHIYYVPITHPRRYIVGWAFNTEGSRRYSESPINSILIVNNADQETLAHEIGHILLDSEHHEAFTTNLMAGGHERARTYVLSEEQCNTMKTFRWL